MTAPRGSRDGLGGDSLSPAVIKGGILIFVALVLGAFLLWRGLDQDNGEIAAGDVAVTDEGSATTSAPSSDSSVAETTTTTAGEARPNEEVTVMVANGSGIPGAAGTITDTLATAGYATTEPGNANQFVDTTVVYYVGSDEAEGVGVAITIGLDPTANPDVVQPMPDPPPVEDLRGATVLVVLGPDLAG